MKITGAKFIGNNTYLGETLEQYKKNPTSLRQRPDVPVDTPAETVSVGVDKVRQIGPGAGSKDAWSGSEMAARAAYAPMGAGAGGLGAAIGLTAGAIGKNIQSNRDRAAQLKAKEAQMLHEIDKLKMKHAHEKDVARTAAITEGGGANYVSTDPDTGRISTIDTQVVEDPETGKIVRRYKVDNEWVSREDFERLRPNAQVFNKDIHKKQFDEQVKRDQKAHDSFRDVQAKKGEQDYYMNEIAQGADENAANWKAIFRLEAELNKDQPLGAPLFNEIYKKLVDTGQVDENTFQKYIDWRAKVSKLNGSVRSMMFEFIKGGGQITEIESLFNLQSVLSVNPLMSSEALMAEFASFRRARRALQLRNIIRGNIGGREKAKQAEEELRKLSEQGEGGFKKVMSDDARIELSALQKSIMAASERGDHEAEKDLRAKVNKIIDREMGIQKEDRKKADMNDEQGTQLQSFLENLQADERFQKLDDAEKLRRLKLAYAKFGKKYPEAK